MYSDDPYIGYVHMNRYVSGIMKFLPTPAHLGRWTITFITCLIAATLGQYVYLGLETAPTFIWPSIGIAITAVFFWGNRMLSAIALAAFVAAASFSSPLGVVIASTISNALQAFGGAYLIRLFAMQTKSAPPLEALAQTISTQDTLRVPEKRIDLQKEYVSLRSIAERGIERASTLIVTHDHTLIVSLPSIETILYADPLRLEQVLIHLLHNAATYTSDGGTIEFRADTHRDKAIITVRDNGLGIDQYMLHKIFEPIIQPSHTTDEASGIGVGLALAKQIVELHDGRISALSAGLGRGSTFVIEIPIVKSSATPSGISLPTIR